MFFSSGKHIIKNFIYENWNFESFDQFPKKKNGMEQTIFKFGNKVCLLAALCSSKDNYSWW